MTIVLRCVLITVSILLTFFVLRRIRQSRMKIEDSIFWVMSALLLVAFSIFPGLADLLTKLSGTYSTANFLFMFMIFLLLVKSFSLSVKVSQLERRVTDLIQMLALDKEEDEKKGERDHEEKDTGYSQ